MLLLRKKDLMVFVSVENKGAYRCLGLTAWRAGLSKIMCNSSATATLPQCVQTLWLWQHADPQQNAREQLAADESPA